MKIKWSKGELLLLICMAGTLDTGGAWLLNTKGWFVIDLIFWPIVFLTVANTRISN